MSYILDALRRADSERERGSVPGLHSKQSAVDLADDEDGEARSGAVRPLWWAVVVLSMAVVSLVVWMLAERSAPEPAMIVSSPVVQQPSPLPAMAAPPDVATGGQSEVQPEPASARTPLERRNSGPSAAAVPAQTRAAAARPRGAERTPAVPPSKEVETTVPSISELPDDIRRQLPTLSVGGATYSKTPGSRMLILNGQVFKEGDKVTNDLVLEQIRLKSAVLSFKGRRYSVSF